MFMRGEDEELRDTGAVGEGGWCYWGRWRESETVERLFGFGISRLVGGGVS